MPKNYSNTANKREVFQKKKVKFSCPNKSCISADCVVKPCGGYKSLCTFGWQHYSQHYLNRLVKSQKMCNFKWSQVIQLGGANRIH